MNGHDPDQGIPDEPAGLANSRALFERSVANIDLGTGNRLRLMRRDALAGGQPRRARWLLTAATASALLLASLAWWLPSTPLQTADSQPAPMEIGDTLLPSEDEAELYAWLGEAPVAVDPAQEEAL